MIECGQCRMEFYVKACDFSHAKFCSKACYQRSRGSSVDPVEAFWMKVEKRGPDECWGWRAQKRWDGYGRFVVKQKPQWAHRFSYELHHGPIAKGMHVMHSCDTPECTNPKHLSLGTRAENMADMAAKRRSRHGSKSHTAKLTEDQVREIRALYWFKKSGNQIVASNAIELSQRYGVTRGTITNAALANTWEHV